MFSVSPTFYQYIDDITVFWPDLFYSNVLIILFCYYAFSIITSNKPKLGFYPNSPILPFNKDIRNIREFTAFTFVAISSTIFLLTFTYATFWLMYSHELAEFVFFDQMFSNSRVAASKMIFLAFFCVFLLFTFVLVEKFNFFDIDHLFLAVVSVFGGLILLSANNFLVFFLALEIVSIPLYVLAASKVNSNYSTEAGLKYLVMGALSSGFILLGLSFFYGSFGVTSFSDLALLLPVSKDKYLSLAFESTDLVSSNNFFVQTILSAWSFAQAYDMFLLGFIFFLFGLLMKMGVAPFHYWMPDVYVGSPSNVTLFFMTVQKFLMWVVLFDLINYKLPSIVSVHFSYFFIMLAIANLAFGIFPALYQTKFKKLLVYSSIGVNSLLFLPIITNNFPMFILFLTVYVLNTFGLFAFYFSFINVETRSFISKFHSFRELFSFKPVLAFSASVLFLASAGLPPTFGFISKFAIYYSAFEEHPFLVGFTILASIVMSFYYFRIIRFMFVLDNKKNNLPLNWFMLEYFKYYPILEYFIHYTVLIFVFSLFYYKRVVLLVNKVFFDSSVIKTVEDSKNIFLEIEGFEYISPALLSLLFE